MDRNEALALMIQEYRKKIETYQAMIDEWERELGQPAAAAYQKADTTTDQSKSKSIPGANPVSLIRDYQFWGKSQPEAAKAFLELVGHPLKTEAIMEGIEKGGLKVGGQTKQKKILNLYTILGRSKDFATVARSTWGLTSWPGVTKKETETDTEINGGSEADEKSADDEKSK
jgi:hypothetical protein